MNGFLSLDKPSGFSSRVVVNRVEEWFPGVKVGHAGTLDPLATGVLVLALGSGTRLVEYVQRMSKTYRTVFRLGAVSDTDDATGQITATSAAQPPTLEAVQTRLRLMIGAIEQVPPEHSAVWVEGKRAYILARKGHALELAPKTVRVDDIRLQQYSYPTLELEIDCGKGTYIRALARDLGHQLGCGAYVEKLCRTRIGPFTLAHCISSDSHPEYARQHLQPLTVGVSELPHISLPPADLLRLLQGQKIELPPGRLTATEGADIAVLNARGELHCISLWKAGRLKPLKVFCPHVVPQER